MTLQPILLPMPREMHLTGEHRILQQTALSVIESPGLYFEGQVLQQALREFSGVSWSLVVGHDYANTGVILAIDDSVKQSQGYHLSINMHDIAIRAKDAAGVYYGVCTLRQLLQQFGSTLPCLEINDWPDFPARGVMLDISRDKVPTLETVMELVDRLAGWKVNQLQLYMEHTFAYQRHPDVWAQATPFTAEDILALDAYCRERHVELVPNQNSLGHMERWLKHPQYLPLAETPEGFQSPWGFSKPTTLNPLDPGSIALIASLYDELLPHFTSRQFNVGGDEPWELGKGKSKDAVERRGGRVYLEYLLKLHAEVTRHGRTMQFWGDIIVKYPELVPELPKDITAMLWGYEGGEAAEHIWEKDCALVSQSSVPFYVCPGTSSWNSLIGRTANTIDNCRIAAEHGLKYGAIGFLNTDWGDNGHWQPLSISYLGFAYGAGIAWALETNRALDVPRALDAFVFEDAAGVMGRLVYDLGNVYKVVGPEHINGQVLAYTLQTSRDQIAHEMQNLQNWGGEAPDGSPETLRHAIEEIERILLPLTSARMKRGDAALIRDEFRQAAALVRHSARRLLLLQGEGDDSPATLLADLELLTQRQQENWLRRNRRGGLVDSVARFERLAEEYRVMSNE
jgi:hypothetical protein